MPNVHNPDVPRTRCLTPKAQHPTTYLSCPGQHPTNARLPVSDSHDPDVCQKDVTAIQRPAPTIPLPDITQHPTLPHRSTPLLFDFPTCPTSHCSTPTKHSMSCILPTLRIRVTGTCRDTRWDQHHNLDRQTYLFLDTDTPTSLTDVPNSLSQFQQRRSRLPEPRTMPRK